MAITRVSRGGVACIYGLASERAATVASVGDQFVENDTGATYEYSGSAWVAVSSSAGAKTTGSTALEAGGSGTIGWLSSIREALRNFVVTISGVVAVGGTTATPAAATMTRPTDTNAYISGDLVANNTTAGSVVPLSFTAARIATGSFMVRRGRLKKSTATLTNASFRLHLYTTSPTPANGDNGAWSTDQAATYLGAIDVTCDKAFTDGATGNGVPNVGAEINVSLASGQTIYGLSEARAAYGPGNAETFIWTLEVLQN